MTDLVPGIKEITPRNWLEVSPELAAERGMESGSKVELTSKWGVIRARVLMTDRVEGKQMYMPMNSSEEPVNRLTGAHVDRATHTPAYKELSVNLRVLTKKGRSPADCRRTSETARRTPQDGCRGGEEVGAGGATTCRGLGAGTGWCRSTRRRFKRVRRSKWNGTDGDIRLHSRRRPVDPRDGLRKKLDAAPMEHAEALLVAYDVIQAAHDEGHAGPAARCMVKHKNTVFEHLAEGAKLQESVDALRNVISLGKVLGAIDPETMSCVAAALSTASRSRRRRSR